LLEPAIIIGLGRKQEVESIRSEALLDESRLGVCCWTSSSNWTTAVYRQNYNSAYSIGYKQTGQEFLPFRTETVEEGVDRVYLVIDSQVPGPIWSVKE
jgi:hypothetical protein